MNAEIRYRLSALAVGFDKTLKHRDTKDTEVHRVIGQKKRPGFHRAFNVVQLTADG